MTCPNPTPSKNGNMTNYAESKLLVHFRKMQRMMVRYLEPVPYVDRAGTSHTASDESDAFISDMIWMLDGPEQREAESALGKERANFDGIIRGLTTVTKRADMAERQVRDMEAELARLRRENAEMRSGGK